MSKALDALELIGYLKDYHLHAVPYCNWLYEIEEYILKAQKQEKALEILKKFFNITFDDKHGMLIICIQAKEDEDTYDTSACANIQFLSYNPNVYNENAKEEFEILKNVLDNSNLKEGDSYEE